MSNPNKYTEAASRPLAGTTDPTWEAKFRKPRVAKEQPKKTVKPTVQDTPAPPVPMTVSEQDTCLRNVKDLLREHTIRLQKERLAEAKRLEAEANRLEEEAHALSEKAGEIRTAVGRMSFIDLDEEEEADAEIFVYEEDFKSISRRLRAGELSKADFFSAVSRLMSSI